ncbi:hypothetical protein LCGC14_0384500 [marine sediment metagenome]|uniref:Uncharacterized protein n=1 Tax=marine sediment metagenome TaxID=412755 RepID=A0A0F9VNM0_9ZZZZ
MPSQYARTIRQVINDTFRICGDYQGNGRDGLQWTWDEARIALKDALLDLIVTTGILKDWRTIPLEEDTPVYDLPNNCLRILRVGIHGLGGTVVFPRDVAEHDYQRTAMVAGGFPDSFFRDTLEPHQIGFYPTPDQAGSTFTRDSQYGLLRRVVDEDGNELTIDANLPLRRIGGVPMSRTGRGRIIREVVSEYGNIQILFLRTPFFPDNPDEYIDEDIPDHIHKDLKYGTSIRLMRGSRRRLHALKIRKFEPKWVRTKKSLQRVAEHKGPLDRVTVPAGVTGNVNSELFSYPTE